MLLLAIAVLSAAILAYEVLLTRLFSIIQWHHFAYMVISIALLGFGASGTFLALTQQRLRAYFLAAFSGNAALFGLSAVASFALAERLPFNALAVIWEPRQLLYLLALYALFTVPFFCGANAIGLALSALPDRIARIYQYDLVGAGSGALGIVLLLFVLPPTIPLRLIGSLGLLAAALASLNRRGRGVPAESTAYISGAIFLALALPPSWTALRLSEYKALSQALHVPGAEVVLERSSPLALLTVVRSPTIPFRHAPGLSLNNSMEPPAQLGVFTDGDALSVITAFDGRLEPLSYLDFTTAALPYHLLERPEVLILGAGGGADVLLALYHGARRVDAVEYNRQFVRLMRGSYADFSGHLYSRPEVHAHVAEARGFIARSRTQYDVIQLPLLDSLATAAAGTLSLNESYIYTIEAFEDYLRHLKPGGYLTITRWLKLPPRDSLKLLATASSALERAGVSAPRMQLALIRSWSTTTLIVKNGVLTDENLAAIRTFAAERSFDLAYLPGLRPEEANRYNLLQDSYFLESAIALVGPDRASFLSRYKFDVAPATDDRPYFFDFFKWRALPELLALRTRGGAALLDWGYLILCATLVQAGLLSIVLILLPLLRRRGRSQPAAERRRIACGFFAIGLAFIFIEIASIQRFVLFLSYPLYAIAVVLCSFLLFAGLGSGTAPSLARRLRAADGLLDESPSGRVPAWLRRALAHLTAIDLAVAAIAILAVLHILILPPLFRWLMPLGDVTKIVISLTVLAPLAFWMGMPFPLALSQVATRVPTLIPWIWGINGCASVLSAVLAALLAIEAGFITVVAIAVALYIAAAIMLRWPKRA